MACPDVFLPSAPRRSRYAPVHLTTIAILVGIFGLLFTPLALVAVLCAIAGWRRGRPRAAVVGLGLGLIGLALIPVLRAGYWTPVISYRLQSEQIERSRRDMMGFAAGLCMAIVEHEAAPRRLDELRRLHPHQLRDRLHYCRQQQANPFTYYLYVRPTTDLATGYPILLEDPAAYDGWLLLLGDATGRTRVLRGRAAERLWAVAQKLAALAQADGRGIAPADWRRYGIEPPMPTRQ